MDVDEPEFTYTCPKCSRTLNSKQGFGKHMAWHERMENAGELGIKARKAYSAGKYSDPLNAYIKHLQEPKQKGGTRLTVDQLNQKITEAFEAGNFLRSVQLTALRQKKEVDEPEKLEQYFIEHAAEYSEAKGITAAAWAEFGVPVRVIKEAGIK